VSSFLQAHVGNHRITQGDIKIERASAREATRARLACMNENVVEWPPCYGPGPTPCRARQRQLLCAALIWIRFIWECNSDGRINSWQHTYTTLQFFTRRTVVLFAIIGLHVFIAWALATGLARRAIELVAPPLQTPSSTR